MKPSISTGVRLTAAPRKAPHIPAMSRPPTFASTSSTSAGSGRLAPIAARIAAFFRSSPASERPAPRPQSASGSQPSRTAATAAAVVVLPMPISPTASRRSPAAARSMASSAPLRMARRQSSRLMAGPRLISAVPFRTRRESTPGVPGKSNTPISTGNTRHSASAAMGLTVLRPSARARVTAAVTPLPHWVTPRATTPLSAQNTSRLRGLSAISAEPVAPAMRSSASSRRPRLPRGLATPSQRFRASSRAAASGSGTAFISLHKLLSIILFT